METVFISTTEGSTLSATARKVVWRASAMYREDPGIVTWFSSAWAIFFDWEEEQEKDRKARENPIITPISTRLKMKKFLEDNFSVIFIVLLLLLFVFGIYTTGPQGLCFDIKHEYLHINNY
jgi:hypothetical protein